MTMKPNHALALTVAYYLSKFDALAYRRLGFTSSTAAHAEIGKKLDVNPNSVKNMRDEFDPLHDNPRAGWYQRPLRPSRAKVVEMLQGLSEVELGDIAMEILSMGNTSAPNTFSDIINPILSEDEPQGTAKPTYIVRGPTGRRAEEIFIESHKQTALPTSGDLIDTRDLGCGYDFEIMNNGTSTQIEVKGMDGTTGGISFTSKEWEVASKNGENYVLVIVRNVSGEPDIQFIRNPAKQLRAKRSVYTVAQIRWNVSDLDLPSDT